MWQIQKPTPLPKGLLGIDPGTTHLGIAYTCAEELWLMQVNLQRCPKAGERVQLMYRLLEEVRAWIEPYFFLGVIEGAAFGERYRQVELAEARAAMALWLMHHGHRVEIVPPISIRKTVFGSVKVRAHDYWDNSEIENDALAALSCLYYAATLEVNDVEK